MAFQSLTEAAAQRDGQGDDQVEAALKLVSETIKDVPKDDRSDFLTATVVACLAMLRQIEQPEFVRGFLHRAVIDVNRPRHAQFNFLD